MRKKTFGIFIIGLLLLTGCENPTRTLPKTDSTNFIKTANQFLFPVGTTDLEIYNCLNDSGFSGLYYTSGTYTVTETAILNGKNYTDTKIKNINKCNIYSEEIENKKESHIFAYHVLFYFDDSTQLDC